ncbi:energy-coupling factor transporter ATPase [Peptoniphilus lacrimalis]|uniref:energy-coupling factor transporter ATPase n=1 Tax=Peptoniphilus TaxID=162289 RepID=UPI0001DCA3F7|nr:MULTISPECIES: energy-coupling factor transporter ATPase [Peptoniphilus]KGF33442.1 cobalt transporter ATP-binding subunit [Peptoniphilus lacrimalis DNF00528]EFK38202.1 cobalt ABC transporter, ATP-binding protein [Peptoniphilus sp. oral taxon 836 str. F0141]MDK7722121.1 energy-coupling factor transporter ATPase [Peptoniphilus lacrimalis]MDK7731633.1 energy-coupling factor transporter ATPase [Peptoniphilus lacrimalis]MDK8282509.1 energy-coupling factor transporter ATPase [Peptoniphilus lacrima
MIEIKDLYFSYENEGENKNPRNVINGVNLNIKEGEFVALLGHNGSGKSTLAKLINALFIPKKGQVLVDGFDTKDDKSVWDIRSRAGMVFQNPDNQLVATVVEDDVAFGPENLGIESSEIRKRVDKALESVNMEDFKKNSPHLLSGGQKQRVAIAGILAMSPTYIILDEPTAMLDPSGRKEVMDTVLKLNKEQGKTIILITHYMDEAAMADRLIIMEEGSIILQGKPREVFSHVDEIKKIGLDVPQVTELAFDLKKQGFNIRNDVLTVEELVEQVCHL